MVMVCLLLTCIVIPARAATYQEQDFASAEVEDIVIFGHFGPNGLNGTFVYDIVERTVTSLRLARVVILQEFYIFYYNM